MTTRFEHLKPRINLNVKENNSSSRPQFGTQFHNTLIRHRFNPIYFMQNYKYFNQILSGLFKAEYIVYLWIYIHISKLLYLLEQHSELFKIWSANIRINTEGISLIMKFWGMCYTTRGESRILSTSTIEQWRRCLHSVLYVLHELKLSWCNLHVFLKRGI